MIQLTERESALILDALNGTMFYDDKVLVESILWQEIADAISLDKLDQKWEVDGPALVAKLKAASHEDATQIVKLAQEFWGERYQVQSVYDRVRAIGMATAAPAGDELLTATDSAKLSGKSVAALGQLAAKSKLSAYRDSSEPNPRRATRYLKSEIVALKTSHSPAPSARTKSRGIANARRKTSKTKRAAPSA